MSNDRLYWALAVGCALVAAVAAYIFIQVPSSRPDFVIFWAAARSSNAYDPAALASIVRQVRPEDLAYFAYPPTALLFFAPLALVPYKAGFVAWVTLSGAALATSTRSRLAPLLMISPVVVWALLAGQTSIFVGALLYCGLLRLDRPFLAGVLIGSALCLKPHLGLLVPVGLLFARRWRAFAAMLATGAVLAIITTVVHGFGIWLDWLNSLRGFVEVNHAQLSDRLIAPSVPAWGRSLILAAGCGLVWYAFRKRSPAEQMIATIGTSLLVTPHGLIYDLAALAPAALAIGARKGWRIAPVAGFLAAPGGLGSLLLLGTALSPSLKRGADTGMEAADAPAPSASERRTIRTP